MPPYVLPRKPKRPCWNVRATAAARAHPSISVHARTAGAIVAVTSSAIAPSGVASRPSSPLTTRNGMPARSNELANSGTGQAPHCASHSPVVVRS